MTALSRTSALPRRQCRADDRPYLRGHLPGAAYLNTETLRATRGGIPTQLLDGPAYAALFSRMGLPFDRRVVIYSAGEIRAAMEDIPGIVTAVEQPIAHLISHMISGVKALGLELWPAREEIAAACATAVKLPDGLDDAQPQPRRR